MKITCAILCYNYGNFLRQAIESCLNQQPGDYELEVLVIDDGSTDNTPEICQLFDKNILTYRSLNEGFSASLTKAVTYATGDYIFFMDADDYFDESKINKLLPFLKKGYLFVKHNQVYVDREGLIISGSQQGGNTSTLVVQRLAASTLLPAENELFFHPLFDTGHGLNVPDILTYYRFHNTNMTNRKDPGVWYFYLARMTLNLASLLSARKCEFFWATSKQLAPIIETYKSVSAYDTMEAYVQLRRRGAVLIHGLRMFYHAVFSQQGITDWHLRVFYRCFIQMRTINEYSTIEKKN